MRLALVLLCWAVEVSLALEPPGIISYGEDVVGHSQAAANHNTTARWSGGSAGGLCVLCWCVVSWPGQETSEYYQDYDSDAEYEEYEAATQPFQPET